MKALILAAFLALVLLPSLVWGQDPPETDCCPGSMTITMGSASTIQSTPLRLKGTWVYFGHMAKRCDLDGLMALEDQLKKNIKELEARREELKKVVAEEEKLSDEGRYGYFPHFDPNIRLPRAGERWYNAVGDLLAIEATIGEYLNLLYHIRQAKEACEKGGSYDVPPFIENMMRVGQRR